MHTVFCNGMKCIPVLILKSQRHTFSQTNNFSQINNFFVELSLSMISEQIERKLAYIELRIISLDYFRTTLEKMGDVVRTTDT